MLKREQITILPVYQKRKGSSGSGIAVIFSAAMTGIIVLPFFAKVTFPATFTQAICGGFACPCVSTFTASGCASAAQQRTRSRRSRKFPPSALKTCPVNSMRLPLSCLSREGFCAAMSKSTTSTARNAPLSLVLRAVDPPSCNGESACSKTSRMLPNGVSVLDLSFKAVIGTLPLFPPRSIVASSSLEGYSESGTFFDGENSGALGGTNPLGISTAKSFPSGGPGFEGKSAAVSPGEGKERRARESAAGTLSSDSAAPRFWTNTAP